MVSLAQQRSGNICATLHSLDLEEDLISLIRGEQRKGSRHQLMRRSHDTRSLARSLARPPTHVAVLDLDVELLRLGLGSVLLVVRHDCACLAGSGDKEEWLV